MTKQRYTYTIDENNAVSVFDTEYPTETGAPNLFQPFHHASPQELFASKEEAAAWAEETIANLLNPPAPDPTTVIIQGEIA